MHSLVSDWFLQKLIARLFGISYIGRHVSKQQRGKGKTNQFLNDAFTHQFRSTGVKHVIDSSWWWQADILDNVRSVSECWVC